MVTFRGLGACREIGSLSLQLDTDKEKFILDHGFDVHKMTPPLKPDMPVNAVFLSHAHLDHCGALPILYKLGYTGSVYGTLLTLEISSLLLVDSIKVQKKRGQTPSFHATDLEKMDRLETGIGYREDIDFKTASFRFYDAGHIPGSSSILMSTEDKKILYTGDINFVDTQLVRKANENYKDLDAVFCESTYYYKNHPNRKHLEDKLRQYAEETISKNGTLILPSFAVGRTQELLLILSDLGLPIHIDGMGIETTKIILSHPEMVRDYRKLKSAFSQAHKVSNNRDRKEAVKKPSIIITTAGMLNGGPVDYYIKKLYKRENCSLVLTGFQVPETVGRNLLDTGRYVTEKVDIKPKMKIDFMDFSAHCGRDDLIHFLEKINVKRVFPIHSDGAEEFANELKELGFDAHAPKTGERINI